MSALVVCEPCSWPSESAAERRRDHSVHATTWPELVDGTTADLLLYVPFYLALSFGVIWLTSWRPRRWWFQSDALAVGVVIALGVADVVETLLFRHTLNELVAGASAADLVSNTDLTRVFSCGKWLLAVAFLVLVFARVVPGPAAYR